ncbi:large conductance mechanosensitive channel protein MscL [Sediminibacillus dalangtanensis]|uniref:Large-conductance mechanosensitive channel n=1 Tax=Sediminibacillus dalangtanensis TaxID=2729421 RepID=A0ABX7VWU1_9BACI|nr:large conductance mechanosensitive channel protein MscL [Sediminibacillus dalangtanensis]
MFKEFRQFILRGNAADMGIGMVLGAAFSSIVDSLVTDVLLPPIGLLLSQMNFSNLYIVLGSGRYETLAEAQAAGAATINYGLFLTSLIRFLIIFFALFLVIRQMNRWKKLDRHPGMAMQKKECNYCRMPIPIHAVRCAHCGSDLVKVETNDRKEPWIHVK